LTSVTPGVSWFAEEIIQKMRLIRVQLRHLALILPLVALSPVAVAGAQDDVPHISADVGSCNASFRVNDGSNKPIYNAKIDVTVHYGFMNLRKTDLEVATNGDGKARVDGLPNFPRKPLQFVVHSGTVTKSVTDDPNTTCKASFDVTLEVH
jgi:hypothetical protein